MQPSHGTYDGLAQVERAVAAKPLRELLPNIISLPPANLHLATSAYLSTSAPTTRSETMNA